VIAARFKQKTSAEWESELGSADTCAAPVLSIGEAPHHPHSVARNSFVDIEGVLQPAPAPRFSRTVPAAPTPPALAGDHTREVLAEAGLDDGTLNDLRDNQVVHESAASRT
jgi:alpha-methylacyl-CoA racemase